jgi:hypothetical protein
LDALLHAVKKARVSALQKANPVFNIAGVAQITVNRKLGE